MTEKELLVKGKLLTLTLFAAGAAFFAFAFVLVNHHVDVHIQIHHDKMTRRTGRGVPVGTGVGRGGLG